MESDFDGFDNYGPTFITYYKLYYTNTGGRPYYHKSTDKVFCISFPDANIGYGIGLGNNYMKIVRTENAGTTWIHVPTWADSNGIYLNDVHFNGLNHGWVIGENGTILKYEYNGKLGDVNWNTNINSTDALIILSCEVGLDVTAYCPMPCGDVNLDGEVNSTDALIVLSYDTGMSVPYPIGEHSCPDNPTPCL